MNLSTKTLLSGLLLGLSLTSVYTIKSSGEQNLDSAIKKVEEFQKELALFLKLMEPTKNLNCSFIDDAFLTQEFINQIVASLPHNPGIYMASGLYGDSWCSLRNYQLQIEFCKDSLRPLRRGWPENSFVEELYREFRDMSDKLYNAQRIIELEMQDPIETVEKRYNFNMDRNWVHALLLNQSVTAQDEVILSKGMSIIWAYSGKYGAINPEDIEAVIHYLEENSHLSKMFIFRALLRALKTIKAEKFKI